MSIYRFKILKGPEITPFILISLWLHIGVGVLITLVVTLGLIPEKKIEETKLPAVKVKYLPPEGKSPPQKVPTFVDAPKPRKVEAPRTSDMIASYNSRAHSDRTKKKSSVYQNKKRIIPKARKSAAISRKSQPTPKKKTVPQLNPTPIKKQFRPYNKGFALPKSKGEVATKPSPKRITGGTLALLDGFDAEKYAAMDTESQTVEDDGEAISLDTRESKYASYFARIKRQIELVWNYPEEAQRKRITGELTLRFQISRDGNLVKVRLINSSGHNILDEAALQAVKSAAPYYPFPVTIDRENLPILANFIYSPKAGLQYNPRP